MRYQYICICYGALFFLTTEASCEPNQLNRRNPPKSTAPAKTLSSKTVPSKPIPPPSTHNTPRDYIKKIDKKNIFINGAALYGIMGDGGLNGTPFAETINPNGENNNYLPSTSSGWGYQVQLGYKLDSNAIRVLTATYTSLLTSATTTVNAVRGGLLYNNFTQFGSLLNDGFHVMDGPATATSNLSYSYQNVSLAGRIPLDDNGTTSIHFYKELSLRYMQIIKDFQAQYNGLITEVNTPTVTAQDNVHYAAHYYGIGPQLLFGATWHLTPKITIQGSGSGGAVAGFYTSNLNDYASASGPVTINTLPALSHYTDNENHPRQAWIPAIFETHVSVLFEIMNNPTQTAHCSIEGGLFLETILPLSTNDSINQNIGEALDKLNNNLNMSGFFLSLNAQFD